MCVHDTVDGIHIYQWMKYTCSLSQGYAGETPMEEAQVDMVKGCFEDIGQGFFKAISGKQDEEKVFHNTMTLIGAMFYTFLHQNPFFYFRSMTMFEYLF